MGTKRVQYAHVAPIGEKPRYVKRKKYDPKDPAPYWLLVFDKDEDDDPVEVSRKKHDRNPVSQNYLATLGEYLCRPDKGNHYMVVVLHPKADPDNFGKDDEVLSFCQDQLRGHVLVKEREYKLTPGIPV